MRRLIAAAAALFLLASPALAQSIGGTVFPGSALSLDLSGTVTLGGTYQLVFPQAANRKGCLIQNPPTATEALNVRVGLTAVFVVPVGGTFQCANGTMVVSDNIYVTAVTTSHAFSAVSQ
jgi:hypothetical protein